MASLRRLQHAKPDHTPAVPYPTPRGTPASQAASWTPTSEWRSVCGTRWRLSACGGVTGKHAELVALGISEDGPPLVRSIAPVVDERGAQRQDAIDLLLT